MKTWEGSEFKARNHWTFVLDEKPQKCQELRGVVFQHLLDIRVHLVKNSMKVRKVRNQRIHNINVIYVCMYIYVQQKFLYLTSYASDYSYLETNVKNATNSSIPLKSCKIFAISLKLTSTESESERIKQSYLNHYDSFLMGKLLNYV